MASLLVVLMAAWKVLLTVALLDSMLAKKTVVKMVEMKVERMVVMKVEKMAVLKVGLMVDKRVEKTVD